MPSISTFILPLRGLSVEYGVLHFHPSEASAGGRGEVGTFRERKFSEFEVRVRSQFSPSNHRSQKNRTSTMKHGRLVVVLLLSQLTTLTLASWIDPDTPEDVLTTLPLTEGDSRTYSLVFSDEFDVAGRTFEDGADPRWTAMNKNDFTNNPLHYYSHEAVQSRDGSLSISLNIEPKDDLYAFWTEDGLQSKEFKSGMVQSWNKFCFTGGIIEFSAKMPGTSNVAGLWPAIWMMGNLGRATYVNSTENMWPFSTNVCDERTRDSQLINSCKDAERFPGMRAGRGRGAPEIDLLEVMYMDEYFENPILSTSLQVAPGVPADERPPLGQQPNSVRKKVLAGREDTLSMYSHHLPLEYRRRRGIHRNLARTLLATLIFMELFRIPPIKQSFRIGRILCPQILLLTKVFIRVSENFGWNGNLPKNRDMVDTSSGSWTGSWSRQSMVMISKQHHSQKSQASPCIWS
jgi:hypothetical protein